MSWDESLFTLIFNRLKKTIYRKSLANEIHKVSLTTLLPRLTVLASALAESHIELFPTRQGMGATREKSIILPVEINFFSDSSLNESLYVCRTAFSALVIREYQKSKRLHPLQSENWAETVTVILKNEFPGLMTSLSLLDETALSITDSNSWNALSRGTFPSQEINTDLDELGMAIELDSKNLGKEDGPTNQKPSLAKVKVLDTTDTNPAVHVFEKALTAEDYQGGKRQIDSDADSSDTSQALSELNMDQVVRATGETGSTYSGGLFLDENTTLNEPEKKPDESTLFYYPEWSRRQLKFIPNWCTVFEEKKHDHEALNSLVIPPSTKKEIKKLKRELEALVNQPVWIRNQPDGTDLDLDAVVRFKTDVKANATPSKNMYLDRKKLEQNIALLILADTSLSTDAWIANRRVFETIQQSLIILSESLGDFSHHVSMAAFFSNTRNHCTYLRIKDFNEDWKRVPDQINSLKPQGYTRMGPAIRHATHLLTEVSARKKILLIISDSKPTDYDAYEGAHGEADVHHAILEARCKQISVKGLAVMEARAGHVKRIYGKSGFEQFTDAHGLSERIVRTYREALS